MAVWTVYLSLCLLIALTGSVEENPVQNITSVGSKDCGACPEGWSSFGCRCFRFFNDTHTWNDAEKNCSGYNGGHLASVHSRKEYKFIQRLIKISTHNLTETWIGGNDTVHEGEWIWSDGSKMNFQIWSPRKPRYYRSSHCLEMNFGYGYWNSAGCYRPMPYVCCCSVSYYG